MPRASQIRHYQQPICVKEKVTFFPPIAVHGQIRKQLIKKCVRQLISPTACMCTDVVDEMKTLLFVYKHFCLLFVFSTSKRVAFLLLNNFSFAKYTFNYIFFHQQIAYTNRCTRDSAQRKTFFRCQRR
jgi:hypothetical protein